MIFFSLGFLTSFVLHFFFQFYPLIWYFYLILSFSIVLMVNQFLYFLSYNKNISALYYFSILLFNMNFWFNFII